MSIEFNLIKSLLKMTKDKRVSIEDVRKDAKLASNVFVNLVKKLRSEGLIVLHGDFIQVDPNIRIQLASKALLLGGDVENIASLLKWQEFEEIAALALTNNGYDVLKNVRFRQGGRRWEIDVVGCKRPLVVCVDCKHYHHGLSPSARHKIVEAQMQRARALAVALPSVKMKLGCTGWDKAKFVPTILSLLPSEAKFCNGIPIVSVLQFQDFVSQLPLQLKVLKYFSKEFNHLTA